VPLALRAIVQAQECGLSVRDGSFGRIFCDANNTANR
jgi:hypothetical protein